MEIALILGFAFVYFVGYYAAHIVNLVARRSVIANLRLPGLGLLVASSVCVAWFVQTRAPANTSSYVVGQMQGKFAVGPALIVAIVVAVRWWLEARKIGKSSQPTSK